jgi:hypothetical protein
MFVHAFTKKNSYRGYRFPTWDRRQGLFARWTGMVGSQLRILPLIHCSSISPPRFAIPFTFATTLGLAAVALRFDPTMKVLSPTDVSAGLPASAAASVLLGKSGAAAVLVLLFLAVTSASSAEMIAVSSILTYDVYKVRQILACLLCIHT